MTILKQEFISICFKVDITKEELKKIKDDEKLRKYFVEISINKLSDCVGIELIMPNTNYKGLKYFHKTYLKQKRDLK